MSIHLEALVGPAGCGKTYELQRRIKENAKYAALTATTGVAAVNLGEGVTTINSLLKFFDLASLKTAHEEGWLKKRFIDLAKRGIKNVAIDEISMFSAAHLDTIHQAAVDAAIDIERINDQRQFDDWFTPLEPVGLIVTGDFLQLPPVDGLYAFHAQCWKEGFSKNVTKMSGSYRQDNPAFLKALNLARRGRGIDCAVELKKLGVKFTMEVDRHFDGTTLFPVNSQVDKLNRERLAEMEGEEFTFRSKSWGKQRGEWTKEIPSEITVKIGALVMVLINQPKTFNFVNGDLATVVSRGVLHRNYWMQNAVSGKRFMADLQEESSIVQDGPDLPVIVRRKQYGVAIPRAISKNLQTSRPSATEMDSWGITEDLADYNGPQYKENDPEFWLHYYNWMDCNQMTGRCYYDPVSKAWVIGEIEHLPIRLGYALTIHKCQGLTLDNVQIDTRSIMAGKPGLMYVALSRCRRPEGITIVGSPYILAKRINTSAEVAEWI